MEALLLYVEMDKAEPVIEELLPILAHKLPKIVAGTLSAFTAIYHAYGVKVVEPKPVLKALPKMYGHADKNVRTEAQNLTVELYRWLKEAMKPLFWEELKPVQQQDLEKLFEKVKDEPAPKVERLLKSQQAAAAKATEVAEEDAGVEEEDEPEVDLEPEHRVVDVLKAIPADFLERMESKKWKDRKEALEEFKTAANHPAIEDGSFDEIIRSLGKCILKDTMVACVADAANCVEILAKGLRKSFAKYRSSIFSPMMERLKERKQTVTDALGAALDAACAATSLTDCLEETMGFLANKNPQVKLEATRFLVRALCQTREAPSVPEVKTIAEASSKLLADSQEPQRNAAAEVLGVLLKIMGERIMNIHLDGLDDGRKVKVKEYSESAEVKSKYKPKAIAPPPKPMAAPPPQKRATAKKPVPAPTLKKPPPPAEEPASPPKPLLPKPTARPVSKPGGPPAGLRGLKAPTSTLAVKKPLAQIASASPRRPTQSPPVDDEPIPAPKIIRGLTGRPLSKPTAPLSEFSLPASTNVSGGSMNADERAEMEDLRTEVERLRSATDSMRSSNESLRSENTRLSSAIHELQDQNAQLIEDHTRDVLSIKAKETQLARARSEAEEADQRAEQLQREVDRLRRDLNRANQATAESAPASSAYRELDDVEQTPAPQAVNRGRRPVDTPLNHAFALPVETPSNFTPAPISSFNLPQRSRTMPVSPPQAREGKENQHEVDEKRVLSPPRSAGLPRPTTNSNSPGRLPVPRPTSRIGAVGGAIGERPATSSLRGPTQKTGAGVATGGDAAGGSGVESWKRAAEVTQNLKARIEMMKVSLFIQACWTCMYVCLLTRTAAGEESSVVTIAKDVPVSGSLKNLSLFSFERLLFGLGVVVDFSFFCCCFFP